MNQALTTDLEAGQSSSSSFCFISSQKFQNLINLNIAQEMRFFHFPRTSRLPLLHLRFCCCYFFNVFEIYSLKLLVCHTVTICQLISLACVSSDRCRL